MFVVVRRERRRYGRKPNFNIRDISRAGAAMCAPKNLPDWLGF
jgi:hypothetical protein